MHDPASAFHHPSHEAVEHSHDPAQEHAGDLAWEFDHLELHTVGIDIGSATSHVMFARVVLVRDGESLSNRYTVAHREISFQAPTVFTPYVDGDLIDVAALSRHIHDSYASAGLTPSDLDTGAVILTGNALERRNAQAIAELFAAEGGKFVCASAGHELEALLAAHGSGSVARSRRDQSNLLNVDVGGGTTKYSAISGGEVVATAAVAGGSRIVAWDDSGRVVRIEETARDLADESGVRLVPSGVLAVADREALAATLARRIREFCEHPDGDPRHLLAGSIPASFRADEIVFSGGVGALVGRARETAGKGRYGDLGPYLAAELHEALPSLGVPVSVATQPMHATVIGAAQFTVQVSGATIHVSDDALPIRNLPVAVVRLDDKPDPSAAEVEAAIATAARRLHPDHEGRTPALFLAWDGIPRYRVLATLARAVQRYHLDTARARGPLVVATTADIAANLGRILAHDLAHPTDLVVVDGVELVDLDHLDIGEVIRPANAVPVVIKSLLFPAGQPALREAQRLEASAR